MSRNSGRIYPISFLPMNIFCLFKKMCYFLHTLPRALQNSNNPPGQSALTLAFHMNSAEECRRGCRFDLGQDTGVICRVQIPLRQMQGE